MNLSHDSAKVLLEKGADVEFKNTNDQRPIGVVLSTHQLQYRITNDVSLIDYYIILTGKRLQQSQHYVIKFAPAFLSTIPNLRRSYYVIKS